MTPTAARTQSLSQPDGWEVRAERFVAMPPGFHITTSPSVLLYHPDARTEGEFEVITDGLVFRGDSPNAYGLFVGGRDLADDEAAWISLEIALDGTWVVRRREFRGQEQGFAFRVGAGLNLHLISFTVESDGETTEWAPQPAESPEEGEA